MSLLYSGRFLADNRSSDYDSSSDPEALEGGTEAPYVLINKVDRKFHDAVCISSKHHSDF